MLKAVGASGQISLGKKYAGQYFEMEEQADGSIVMVPMKVVPASAKSRQSASPPLSYGQGEADYSPNQG